MVQEFPIQPTVDDAPRFIDFHLPLYMDSMKKFLEIDVTKLTPNQRSEANYVLQPLIKAKSYLDIIPDLDKPAVRAGVEESVALALQSLTLLPVILFGIVNYAHGLKEVQDRIPTEKVARCYLKFEELNSKKDGLNTIDVEAALVSTKSEADKIVADKVIPDSKLETIDCRVGGLASDSFLKINSQTVGTVDYVQLENMYLVYKIVARRPIKVANMSSIYTFIKNEYTAKAFNEYAEMKHNANLMKLT